MHTNVIRFSRMAYSAWSRRGIILFIAASGSVVAGHARAQGKHTMAHLPVAQEMKLNSGNTIPTVGLGVFLVKSSKEISTGLSAGYRSFSIFGTDRQIASYTGHSGPYLGSVCDAHIDHVAVINQTWAADGLTPLADM